MTGAWGDDMVDMDRELDREEVVAPAKHDMPVEYERTVCATTGKEYALVPVSDLAARPVEWKKQAYAKLGVIRDAMNPDDIETIQRFLEL